MFSAKHLNYFVCSGILNINFNQICLFSWIPRFFEIQKLLLLTLVTLTLSLPLDMVDLGESTVLRFPYGYGDDAGNSIPTYDSDEIDIFNGHLAIRNATEKILIPFDRNNKRAKTEEFPVDRINQTNVLELDFQLLQNNENNKSEFVTGNYNSIET